MNRALRWIKPALLLAALIIGVMTTRVAVMPAFPCGVDASPRATVLSESVSSPFLYGVVSGLSLGAWPTSGYGSVSACVFSDVGVGMTLPAFKLIRLDGAYAWAAGRGVGFMLASWGLLFVASWVWRAARILHQESRVPPTRRT